VCYYFVFQLCLKKSGLTVYATVSMKRPLIKYSTTLFTVHHLVYTDKTFYLVLHFWNIIVSLRVNCIPKWLLNLQLSLLLKVSNFKICNYSLHLSCIWSYELLSLNMLQHILYISVCNQLIFESLLSSI